MFIAANVCTFPVYMYFYLFDRKRQSLFYFLANDKRIKKKKRASRVKLRAVRLMWRAIIVFSRPPHQKASPPSQSEPGADPIVSSHEEPTAKLVKISNITTRQTLQYKPSFPHFQSPFIRKKWKQVEKWLIDECKEKPKNWLWEKKKNVGDNLQSWSPSNRWPRPANRTTCQQY